MKIFIILNLISKSLAVSNFNGISKIHYVYEKNNKIYYTEFYKNKWSLPFLISHSNKIAANPSIEVYGDSLYVVWNEDYYETGKWEIFRNRKKLTEPSYAWSETEFIFKNLPNSKLGFKGWKEEEPNLNSLDFVLIDEFDDSPNYPYAPIHADDIDEDGLSEVIFGLNEPPYFRIGIYERNPNGGFNLVYKVPYILPPYHGGVGVEFGIGDFDNDGKKDIIQTTYGDDGVNMIEYFEVVESKERYTYPDTIVWLDSLYIEGNNPDLDVWVGKFDFDDKTDIVIYKGYNSTDLLIYENKGDNFYNLVWHKNYYSDTNLTNGGFAVGDLDMDGRPELILVDASHARNCLVRFWEAAGDDSIAIVDTLRLNNIPDAWPDYDVVFCGDVNNNTKPEVMIHGPTPTWSGWRDDIWIIEAIGDNDYALIWYDSIPDNFTYPCYGATSSAGDLTGDGIPEIVLSMTARVYVIQYIPGQGYTYVWQKYFPWNTADLATAVYDIDGDGLNEMILSVEYSLQNPWTYIYKKSPSVSEKYQKILPYFYVSKNITSDSLKIFYDLNTKNPSHFYIYNIVGEKVYYKKLLPKGELNLDFRKLKFKPGIYFLKIDSEKIKKIEKVIYLKR